MIFQRILHIFIQCFSWLYSAYYHLLCITVSVQHLTMRFSQSCSHDVYAKISPKAHIALSSLVLSMTCQHDYFVLCTWTQLLYVKMTYRTLIHGLCLNLLFLQTEPWFYMHCTSEWWKYKYCDVAVMQSRKHLVPYSSQVESRAK